MLVMMPMVGWMMVRRASISPGCEMPASKMPTSVRSSSIQTERGTPICELYDRGDRVTRFDGASSW